MKKVLLTTCVVVCAAVAASAQGVGTVKLMNWEAQQYQNSRTAVKADRETTRTANSFAGAIARAGAAAALKHQAAAEAAETGAAATDSATATASGSTETTGNNPAAKPAAPAKKPAAKKKAAKKKGFWDYVLESIPTDGHCSTQPFK